MKYPSRYSNEKFVSAAQYITEMICEKKAKIDKEDLHHRFWTSKKWSSFFRNQIATANKLVTKYGEKAVIRALKNPKAERMYSLRAPHLLPIIEQEAEIVSKENSALTKSLERKDNVSHRQSGNNPKNILSKLEDIDNGT
jgi:hypothetical protein